MYDMMKTGDTDIICFGLDIRLTFVALIFEVGKH